MIDCPRGKGEEGMEPIGLKEARQLVERYTGPLGSEMIPLLGARGRLLARRVVARADSPNADVSLKDGYALRSRDTARASEQGPVRLPVGGSRFAGDSGAARASPGTCVKIMSGAILPEGADAVVGAEFCTPSRGSIEFRDPVAPGQNVMTRGTDIAKGAILGKPGDRLGPGMIGWLAAAGIEEVVVCRLPTVSVVATGDEVVAPGSTLKPGQLYASNLVTLSAWLDFFGITTAAKILPDRPAELRRELFRALEGHDVLLTSGGPGAANGIWCWASSESWGGTVSFTGFAWDRARRLVSA